MRWRIKKYQNIMTHIDLKTGDKHDLNLHFNDVFKLSIERGLNVLRECKLMAGQEYGWLEQANENILSEMMSWKNKSK